MITTIRSVDFLPTTAKEVKALGWEWIDVILFTGDAYVDHPSFGAAVIARRLQADGYRVAVVPQPNWRDDLRDFSKLGAPRLFFGVTAGNMDSMVNHYTANIRLRSNDAYTPGGVAGFRPDYATTVYAKILKRLFPHTPVVIGGIEASLRRLAHYDYWSDSVKSSVLIESGADLLIYGMGDETISEVARAMHNGYNAKILHRIKQVGFVAPKEYGDKIAAEKKIVLNSYERCVADKAAFAENFVNIETESNRMESDKVIIEPYEGEKKVVIINPAREVMSTMELDRTYDLPFTRLPHPRYRNKGEIPAYEMIKFSINIHRGCFGGCSFCTISAHQGKFITSRSAESIVAEIKQVIDLPMFRGNLSDLGGPSANMYRMGGRDKALCKLCRKPSCIYPKICSNLNNDHTPLLDLYRKACGVNGIKKIFIGSGIRYDLFDALTKERYLREVIVNHTSGRLKVAPEHTSDTVLRLMRKPSFAMFERLNTDFRKICSDRGLKFRIIPYFISSHPGCAESDMKQLAGITTSLDFDLEQVQDFTPTPMTLSSVMFHTGIDPYTGNKLYVAKNQDDKRRQKSYFFKKQK